jgi:hypothetical protein
VRCGYQDYTAEQIETIQQTHSQNQRHLIGNTDAGYPIDAQNSVVVTDIPVHLPQGVQSYHGAGSSYPVHLPPHISSQSVDYPLHLFHQQGFTNQEYNGFPNMPAGDTYTINSDQFYDLNSFQENENHLHSNDSLPHPEFPQQELATSNQRHSLKLSESPATSGGSPTGPSSYSDSPSMSNQARKVIIEAYIHPIESVARRFYESSSNSSNATNSPYSPTKVDKVKVHKKSTSPQFNHSMGAFEIPLVQHKLNKPEYDVTKYTEFMGESISLLFSRIFLLIENHDSLTESWTDKALFLGTLLRSTAMLLPHFPELTHYFLKYRVRCINSVRQSILNISDSNAKTTLGLASNLFVTTCFYQDSTFKDFFSLAAGPGILLKVALENPHLVPNSFPTLQGYADGFMFTSKYVWLPAYPSDMFYEFRTTYREFGQNYIHSDKNHDEKLMKQYDQLAELLDVTIDLFENHSLPDSVVKFPIERLFELMKKGLSIIPSEIYTVSSNSPPISRVFYVFWHAFMEMSKFAMVDCSYIFTFSLSGFYNMYTFDREQLADGLNDDKLLFYLNYSCRIMAFLIRRHSIVLRNAVLNDPVPNFLTLKDRLKTRTLDIHEVRMKSFKNSYINRVNYPLESLVSENLVKPSDNYYKKIDTDELNLVNDLSDLFSPGQDSASDGEPDEFDFINDINQKTSLLNRDYDPRYTNPVFNETIIYQTATSEFLEKYIEDRRLILQMKTETKS